MRDAISKITEEIDLCDRETDFADFSFSSEDVALIAVPSYGGRVPALAAERIKKLNGNEAKAVLVCVYGNRAYDNTLAELQALHIRLPCRGKKPQPGDHRPRRTGLELGLGQKKRMRIIFMMLGGMISPQKGEKLSVNMV